MKITILPSKLQGTISAIPSKSQAHRLLICAAFSSTPLDLICLSTNEDIEATVQCLNAIGARITRTETGYYIIPIQNTPKKADLYCRESGSTLRFMLPIIAALGIDGTFYMEGRLPSRPLSPLVEELCRMGCTIDRQSDSTLRCSGKLQCGEYHIDGSVSSQYITGLIFALSLLSGESTLNITGQIESAPYIDMTVQALQIFGVNSDGHTFTGYRPFTAPQQYIVEGDWSNAAFFLGAKFLGNQITINGLSVDSKQGDKVACILFQLLSDWVEVSGKDTPDLIPILAVVAAANKGAHFYNISRLRLKESDRIEAVKDMLIALGGKVITTKDSMTVYPAPFNSCVIDSKNDHRIAMAAAIASTISTGPITILGAECVKKSYPSFWDDFVQLGGYYEQHIR